MSVIVEQPDGQIVMITKGADSIIAERLSYESKNSVEFKKTQTVVDKYANEGLRTLFLTERVFNKREYEEWN